MHQPNERNSDTTRPRALVVATLPPPVTGMTLVTKVVVDSLQKRAGVFLFNWSSRLSKGRLWRCVRTLRSLASALWLLCAPKRAASCYFVANSRGGLLLNVLNVAAARLRGYRCVLHHHVYSYLTRGDWRMKIIDRLMGPNGVHVVLCCCMRKQFIKVYQSRCQFVILSNTLITGQENGEDRTSEPPTRQANDTFRLGHLSNLTVEKGLREVLATFEQLLDEGHDVELLLAGPTASEVERELIEQCRQRTGSRLNYLGPVYDKQKEAFFDAIDVMLFPTQYRNEAQPLVIIEALAEGKPVIAYGRGCIPKLLEDAGGAVVDPAEDYLVPAAALLNRWIGNPSEYRQARELARRRFVDLQGTTLGDLNRFATALLNDDWQDVVARPHAA